MRLIDNPAQVSPTSETVSLARKATPSPSLFWYFTRPNQTNAPNHQRRIGIIIFWDLDVYNPVLILGPFVIQQTAPPKTRYATLCLGLSPIARDLVRGISADHHEPPRALLLLRAGTRGID